MVLADGGGDRVPIVGREGAQVDDFGGDTFAFELRGGDFRTMHDGTEGDDADLVAFLDQTRFAERDGVVGARIFGAIVGLAIEMFVLEEHHGIIAANRGPEKTGDIKGCAWHYNAQSRTVGKDGFAA